MIIQMWPCLESQTLPSFAHTERVHQAGVRCGRKGVTAPETACFPEASVEKTFHEQMRIKPEKVILYSFTKPNVRLLWVGAANGKRGIVT